MPARTLAKLLKCLKVTVGPRRTGPRSLLGYHCPLHHCHRARHTAGTSWHLLNGGMNKRETRKRHVGAVGSAGTGQTPSSSSRRVRCGRLSLAQPIPLPSGVSSHVPSSRKPSLVPVWACTSSGLPTAGLPTLGHYYLVYRSFIPFPHPSNEPQAL